MEHFIILNCRTLQEFSQTYKDVLYLLSRQPKGSQGYIATEKGVKLAKRKLEEYQKRQQLV